MNASSEGPGSSSLQRKSGFSQTFSSLRYRDYRLLFLSTLLASGGNWVQQITLGWLIYEFTGSAFLVGALHGARTLPFLLGSPLGGVLTDKMERRILLLMTQIALGVLALGFALLLILDWVQIWHFFAFTLVSGVAWAINNPVRQAMVVNTLPSEELLNGIALTNSAFNVNRIAGPALGGLLIALFGPALNFLVQALLFLSVVLVIIPMRSETKKEARNTLEISFMRSFTEGIRYVRKEPTTRALLILTMVPAIFVIPFTTGLMPVFAEDVVHVGPDGLGILLMAFGTGSLIGPLLIAGRPDIPHRGVVILLSAGMGGVALIALSQTSNMLIAMLVLVPAGIAMMLYHTLTNTTLQILTPDEFRGRVTSLYMMDHGLVPLGSVIAGALAQAWGAPTAILIGGVACTVVVAMASVRYEIVRRL